MFVVSSPPGGPYIPIMRILFPLVSYTPHAILPFFCVSCPSSTTWASIPCLTSIRTPPLLCGVSLFAPYTFPFHESLTSLSDCFFSLVSVRIRKSAFVFARLVSTVFLFLQSPIPFTFMHFIVFFYILFCCPLPFCGSV